MPREASEYERPGHEGPSSWLVFDPRGRLEARLEVPRGFLPLEWCEEQVLGVLTDDLGVERVRLHRIERP